MKNCALFCLLLLFSSLKLLGQEGFIQTSPLNQERSNLEQNLLRQFPQLQNNPQNLEFIQFIESPGARHYTYRQKFQDLPIYNSYLKVHLDKSGKIRALRKKLFPITQKSIPSFKLKMGAVKARMREEYVAYDSQIEAALFYKKGEFIPIFHIQNSTHGPNYSTDLLIDGRSGEEIFHKDLGIYAKALDQDTLGSGRVFIPNPCTRANVNYGDLFIDSMDFHKAIFDNLMDTVVLKDICFEGDSFSLKGPYVEIADLESPAIAPVKSADGNFFFRRDESGFEQVMAYYHIDHMQRWIQSLGYTNLHRGPIRVDPEGTNSDNSVTVINDSIPVLLFGLGGVDDAEDADVILHEYGHAISYYASGEIASRGSRERAGLDEGIGDYLAAIYSQDLGYDNWNLLFNWDGHNEFWAGRIANGTQVYPPPDSSIFTFGGIWAAALLEIRETLGKGIADSLFFEELFLNDLNTGLIEGAQMIMLADSLLFGGEHVEEIRFIFCERGLVKESKGDCSVVSTRGDLPVYDFTIYPNPNQGDLHLHLPQSIIHPDIFCIVYNMQGQIMLKKSLNTQAVQALQLPPLSPGVYQLKVFSGQRNIAPKKFHYLPKY